MGFKYTVHSDKLYFLTNTVIDWIDVFTRQELAMIVVDSLAAGVVYEPQQYVLSSARDYYENIKGLVNICYLG